MRRLFLWIAFVLTFSTRVQAVPIHILVTGDMHGWLQPVSEAGGVLGGASEMLATWKRVEHYTPEDFLILSAGDIATGPAISTVFKGVPAVEVMNAMGYDATALGNHEFDFGMPQIEIFRHLAHFPFLSANVVKGPEGQELLVPAFCVIEKSGLKIGIIGLTTTELKSKEVRELDYVEAIRRWVPQARAQGAQVLLLLAHLPMDELRDLAGQVGDLGIPLMMGGHSHELGQLREPNSGTWIVNSGEWWKAYSRVDLDYDTVSAKTLVLSSKQVWQWQQRGQADLRVKALVNKWQAKLDSDPVYGQLLGYLGSPLELFWPVSNFVCDAWLEMDPQSDIVLNNEGALRQNLEAGKLTRAQLVGLLPFSDKLYRLTLSGRQISHLLPRKGRLMGLAGLAKKGHHYYLNKTGLALDPKGIYHVLLNSYMVETNPALQAADPNPLMVAQDWREPLAQWLLKHPSSPQHPLEKLVDFKPRL